MKKLNKKLKLVIKQADCIQFLSSLDEGSIDLIVTDPAYSGMNNHLKLGKGRIVGNYKQKGTVGAKWFTEFEDSIENYEKFLSECKRILNKKTGHIYIMFDAFSLLSLGHVVRKYFSVKNIITWDKINIGMGHYFRRRHEFIMFATNKNARKLSSQKYADVWSIKRLHNAKYPTQKPVELFDMMLDASGFKNCNVCDPFLGSGSSAISALNHKYNFWGCDISPEAINFAKKRIKEFKGI
ncbi:site-specific DNA-methyltransferase [Candidatus Dojkabacteria bacterium]|jgi:site-specific DNA-methyltransferase (adenine-specific)|nr:site-specific DNA-methyltransferase [Candidatus Dojkabacteria bacterium]